MITSLKARGLKGLVKRNDCEKGVVCRCDIAGIEFFSILCDATRHVARRSDATRCDDAECSQILRWSRDVASRRVASRGLVSICELGFTVLKVVSGHPHSVVRYKCMCIDLTYFSPELQMHDKHVCAFEFQFRSKVTKWHVCAHRCTNVLPG